MSGLLDRITQWIDLNLGSSGRGRGNMVIIALLGVIIIASLVLAGAFLFGGGDDSRDIIRENRTAIHFFCTETQLEVQLEPQAVAEDIAAIGQSMELLSQVRVTNPQSGRRTLIQMMRCPACKKYFVPAAWLNPTPPAGPRPKTICTHCKIDVGNWRPKD